MYACVCLHFARSLLAVKSLCLFDSDCPRDLTDEILLQLVKQEQDPNPDSVLSQLTETHLVQTISDVFLGITSDSQCANMMTRKMMQLLYMYDTLHVRCFLL